ncbi:3-deoxy-manno-octulosonate cytidylyltransferase [Flavihumibacter petaseus]|uniref:3-deoxy-D-manno-octulosonate cytidylyltransferase n=1 Tax=Flavihumibacter petaseus NBRC 106054 TaxID=1220578 RepID=A0A0E9MW86_9BACT|nr:3-deoxy-manno-octulosonate cytidylyltransferase [Flavihumibacter petaseus]GAO41696.1 3-deoxy-D-manno-octulosonate cytidylyltransferase [Flavihumibacter petaseus NBRC 106054]
MKTIALIPARYAATRFPGKMLADLAGKSVILRTYEAAVSTGLFDDVAVVCDHDLIYNEIVSNGGKAIRSKKEHECGTDRIAEAAAEMDADIVVNVQGDEPFTKRAPLEKLLQVFQGPAGESVEVASLMQVLTDPGSISNTNFVKVAIDLNGNALFFSRSPIPYHRNQEVKPVYYEHIGVYAFRKKTLIDFTALPVSPLEAAEKIECLRYLENGIRMKMVVTDYMGVEIDTPEDLEKATRLL